MKKTNRVLKNSMLLYFRMVVGLLVSLYVSRVSLDILGVDTFGLYTIIASFVIVGGVLVNVATVSMQRHLCESIGNTFCRTLNFESRSVLSACVIVNALLGISSILIIFLFGSIYLDSFLNQNIVHIDIVWKVFYVSLATFFMSFVTSPYLTVLISFEDTKYYALIMMLEIVSKLISIFFMYLFGTQSILDYTIAIFISVFVTRCILFLIVRSRYENVRLILTFDWSRIKPILVFTGWNLWGGVASVISLQGVTFLINSFFDLQTNTARAISLQIYSAITQLVNSIQLAIAPQLVKSNGQDDSYFSDLFILSGKITVYLAFLISFVLYENTETLLSIWLDDYPSVTVMFLNFTYIEVIIISLSYPILSIVQANGNIKKYQVAVGGLMLLNVPLMYFAISLYESYEYIYIVSIFISVVSLIYRLIYAKFIFGEIVNEYIFTVVFKGILVLVLSFSLTNFIYSESLLLNVFINSTLFSIIFFLIMLSREEKRHILARISKLLRVNL
jgi:O-antigen/teichoic acid export membrane protein